MSSQPPQTGTLFVVSTPIGNLEDITLRALRILREVPLIAAEDTRHTARLLTHFGITTRTTSLHEHNERERTAAVLDRLERGDSVALVTDAGTPLLSDPGRHLARTAIAQGLRVEPVPGPSALLAALAGSAAVDGPFMFLGFAPRTPAARRRFFEHARDLTVPFVMFESPHRLGASLQAALDILGDRPVVVCRELTKVHETFDHTTLRTAASAYGAKDRIGEVTLVISPSTLSSPGAEDRTPLTDAQVWAAVSGLMTTGSTRRQAVAAVARQQGRAPGDIYAAAERGKARPS